MGRKTGEVIHRQYILNLIKPTGDNKMNTTQGKKRYFGKKVRALITVTTLIEEYGRYSKDGKKVVSETTRHERLKILQMVIKQLHELGYKITDIRNLKKTHIKIIVDHWKSQDLSPATWQKRLSILKLGTQWIGKGGLVDYKYCNIEVETIKRTYVAKSDKSWSAKKAEIGSIEEKIKEVEVLDLYVAMQLRLQLAFGLRSQESWLLKPHENDMGNYLVVIHGTKGGRRREVDVETEEQRHILNQAKLLAPYKTASIIPKTYSLGQWKNHYIYICRKAGIRRDMGIVSHGLRHEYLNNLYEQETGIPSVVRGGGAIDKDKDLEARKVVSKAAGHKRDQITNSYIGGRADGC